MEDKNINISVEKRRKSIIPLVIVVLIILIGAIGVIYYKVTDKEPDLPLDSQVTDNSVVPEENKVEEEISDEAKAVYLKLKTARWASKDQDKYVLFTIDNGKLVYISGESNGTLEYPKNDVKFLTHIVKNGVCTAITFVTTSNEAYIAMLENMDDAVKYDLSNVKFRKVDLGEEIIDITFGEECVIPNSGPYYLTESGKLLNEDKVSYDEINKDHILMIGNASELVFVNSNKTIEVLRNNSTNEYLNIVDSKGNAILARDVFTQTSNNLGSASVNNYYVVDNDKKLLEFSASTLFVASQWHDARDKKVYSIEYDESKSKIKITFTDDSYIVLENISYYSKIQ